MALPQNRYVVLSESKPTKRTGGSWFEKLRRWLVQCPSCSEIRLVVGAQENESHVCRDCGHSFLIKFSTAAKDR